MFLTPDLQYFRRIPISKSNQLAESDPDLPGSRQTDLLPSDRLLLTPGNSVNFSHCRESCTQNNQPLDNLT